MIVHLSSKFQAPVSKELCLQQKGKRVRMTTRAAVTGHTIPGRGWADYFLEPSSSILKAEQGQRQNRTDWEG